MTWKQVTGAPAGGHDIAADDNGNVFLTTSDGKIYQGTSSGQVWKQFWTADGNGPLYYGARSITTNGSVVVVVDARSAGFRAPVATGKWTRASLPNPKDMGLLKSGTCWMVGSTGALYTSTNLATYTQQQGSDGVRIAAGGSTGSEQVWLSNTVGKVYKVKWNGHFHEWTQMSGSSVRDVAVGNDGTVWCTNSSGSIFKWNGTGWTKLTGSDASRIAVGASTLWMVNTAGKVYRMSY